MELGKLIVKYVVKRQSGCWEWHGPLDSHGYGQARISRRMRLMHRAIYESMRGPIPTGLTLDHLCRIPSCVNPDHLEPVSHRENILRGIGPAAQNAKKTVCLHGHPLDGLRYDHTRRNPRRFCRTCGRAAVAAYQQKRKDAAQ
jgi:hypothetical protein